jgi:Acyltransferase family
VKSWLAHHGDAARPKLAVFGGGGARGAERVRYLDLLRPVAIGSVVYGHWLLIGLTYSRGRFSDLDTLDYVAWGRWLTWAFQVMPVFFLVGGYANALSWTAHHTQGERWNWWIQRRAMRL